jgi:hypothetical protein
MPLVDNSLPGHETYWFPCSCHDWHYLEVDWDDEDEQWRALNIADTYWPRSWRDRLQAAFKMLRNKPHYHTGVLLTNEHLEELRTVLNKYSTGKPAPRIPGEKKPATPNVSS